MRCVMPWADESISVRKTTQLFTDLVFADFLVTFTPFVSKVIFQYVIFTNFNFLSYCNFGRSPKLIPWFVSDVTAADFIETIASLVDLTFFDSYHPSPPEKEYLSTLVSRLQRHLDNGTFGLSVDPKTPFGKSDERANFWTEPWPYWDMKIRAENLWKTLSESGLVIFKVRSKTQKESFDLDWLVTRVTSSRFFIYLESLRETLMLGLLSYRRYVLVL